MDIDNLEAETTELINALSDSDGFKAVFLEAINSKIIVGLNGQAREEFWLGLAETLHRRGKE